MKTTFLNQFVVHILIFLMAVPLAPVSAANEKMKDFRATNQKVALLGVVSEFVEPQVEDKWVNQIRKLINRYSRSYGQSSIQSFNLGGNSSKQFFKPSTSALEEQQKKFLQKSGKDNSIDIIVLGALRETGDQFEMELQLFDVRIETMSGIEKANFTNTNAQAVLEGIVFRLMNYVDRDGFVHPQPQDLLESPDALKNATQMLDNSATKQEFSVNPNDLGGGYLAGTGTVGGEKTPFWETWWFWTIIGGGLVTGGSLAYYFLVIDQPTSKANVTFKKQ